MSEELNIGSGMRDQVEDIRDHLFSDLLMAGIVGPVTAADYENGYSAYDEMGIKPEDRDQNGRLSCVAESCAMYGRVLRKAATGEDVIFAASSIYPFIRLDGGGAYIRDGAKEVVAGRLAPKSVIPDEDVNGRPLPESAVMDRTRVTSAVAAAAVKLDIYDNYRMLDGTTDDIDAFAAAIRTGKGALLGFTGTNQGWSCPACRAPLAGENKWGHCVFSCEFGLTDVAAAGLPAGSKALFIPNSWGGRYTFTTGRWAGRQALPESYFKASENTAQGPVAGIYVSPAWTIIPSAIVPPDVWAEDFLRQHDRKLARNKQTGARGLILRNQLMVVTEARAGLAALACIDYDIGQVRRIDIEGKDWDRLPKSIF